MPGKTANYAIVTPCKNEEWNLPNLIKSVLAQTIRPVLWVIVDDGSTDKSGEILDQLGKEHDWIKVIHLKEEKEYLGAHISYVYNSGFEYIKNYSDKSSLQWEYIGILDSDAIAEPEYFEKLIKKFEINPKLGIASGSTCENTENIIHILEDENSKFDVMNPEFWVTYPFSLKDERVRLDLPMGSARLWEKKCFEETGGCFDNINMPDAISNVKAKIKGWETARFPEIKLIERSGLSARGSWYGYIDRGRANYVVKLPPYIVLLKALNYSFKKPYYLGIAYLWGYFESLISRKDQVKDEGVIRYYRSVHFNVSRKFHKEKVKTKFSNK
ncbi:hypothetical protein MSSAC_3437 [Methanosarcina siciliae C2J]|uniref:Glycosyltransferase 2-like domain-containing protein n=1 Tax=Methanosarcina siciliae C2J TaxID=1434118 RepID=A0A0E3PQA7_9EURY|nr:glycosyltransferase family 2 protein [Methanosarcina siciliae]AKB38027.1 hypothetical protein MSSAC_3437 [Methanosarcina siciliae C2J]